MFKVRWTSHAVVGALALAGFVALGSQRGVATPAALDWAPIAPWPLGDCADLGFRAAPRLCLHAVETWRRFGVGAPEVSVAVVETRETRDVWLFLDRHPWLDAADIPVYSHVSDSDRVEDVAPIRLPQPAKPLERFKFLKSLCDEQRNSSETDELAFCTPQSEERARGLSYLGWQAGSPHEIQMLGLILGQDPVTMRRTGLAPLSSASLHYVETTPSRAALHGLKRQLDRIEGTRVVNFSNEGPAGEFLDRQYARLYATALAVNAGQGGVTGRNPDDRLLVASSANTRGIVDSLIRRRAPHPLLPPEARTSLEQARQRPQPSDRRPRMAHALPRPNVPMLVVGGLGANGSLYGRARVEPGIDLYAPGGLTTAQAASMLRETGRLGRDDLAQASMRRSLARRMHDCRPLPLPDALIGIPTLDWGPSNDLRTTAWGDALRKVRAELARNGPGRRDGCRAGGGHTTADGVFFALASGNSTSTALVSAVASQMLALDPQLSARDAAAILRVTAQANRVNGLPALDPRAALGAVLEGYVARYVSAALLPRLVKPSARPAGWFDDAARPARPPGGQDPSFLPTTLSSSAVAPGLLGQATWLERRDDLPIRVTFEVALRRGNGLCRMAVILETETRRQGPRTARLIRRERFAPPPVTRKEPSCVSPS